jgi:uncharacterized membrane protein YdjX (TVP38/TMEM64 family)
VAGRDPEVVRQWIRISRDAAIVIVGTFMLIWQTVFATIPNPMLVGAGLVLLGLPPTLRGLDMLPGRNGHDKKDLP